MSARPANGWVFGVALLGLAACHPRSPAPLDEPEPEPPTTIELRPLTEGVWLHTSIRELEGYGPFPSHGLIIDSPEGPLLIDTAWGEAATMALLAEIEAAFGGPPRAAIVTDFHDDRAGGIAALRAAGVEVVSSAGIAARLEAANQATPSTVPPALEATQTLAGEPVELWFPGAGHSPENLVVWLPEHELLFGGCLVRPYDSRSLGNTGDAEIPAWPDTMRAVRARYGSAALVVPSHGDPGGPELLDHTLALTEIARAAAAEDAGEAAPTRMAITVDDLPVHGPLPPGTTRVDIHDQLVQAFAAHGVPDVRGFVVGERALASEDHREALELWLDAGHPLGNHTWSHPNMEEIGVEAYLEDIDRNEALLAELTGDASGRSWRSFRYPYLRQGFDADSSTRVRAHLADGGYQIAEVTIDFWDWAFQKPYARCLEQGPAEAVAELEAAYLDHAIEMLDWHLRAAREGFGRPIAHVLLLHAGAFTAEMLDALLTSYEARGVMWIDLDEALADPVYRAVPLPPKTHGDVLVEQAITSLGVEHPPWPSHPRDRLDAMCKP